MRRATLQAGLLIAAVSSAPVSGSLVGCRPSTIRVNGVMQQSSEMRPLPSVPVGAYKELRVFVRPAPAQDSELGTAECGFARLAGTDEGQDLKNAACVPAEALSAVVRIVRERFRSYGVQVERDAKEPYDYRVDVAVTGEAPKAPDPTLAKAVATASFQLNTGVTGGTLMSSIGLDAARAAFGAVAKDCSMKGADLSTFSGTSRQPMTPDFDVQALASDVVDDVLRCDDLARFFMDARTRFPR